MRIVITSISFCEYVIQQANALAGLGHDIMLIMPEQLVAATVGSEIGKLLAPRVKFWTYDTLERRRPTFYVSLLRVVSSFSPDVFHIHDNGGVETFALAVRFHRVPLVVTIHDVSPHPGADSWSTTRGKIIRALLKRRADVIHLHGEVLHNKFKEMLPDLADKVSVISHGTLSLFKYWEKGVTEKEPLTCLFFGRMEKYRGLDSLLKIGLILRETVPGIKIIVAGTGSELEKYKAEMTAIGIFEVHDAFIPNKDIFRYFRRASLLLLPYHEASQSGVVSMGFPFGLPVVATAVGSIPEVVIEGINGKIVSAGDVAGFADTVRELLADGAGMKRMSDHCIRSAEQLDFRNLANKFVELYSRAISRKLCSCRKDTYVEQS
jgi:glycosyltransferase involved in cell wall biosynthesis